MTLQEFVVSQPLADRMKGLGWEQEECIFRWKFVEPNGYDTRISEGKWEVMIYTYEGIAAPSFQEIWERLPSNAYMGKPILKKYKSGDSEISMGGQEEFVYSNPAEAAGELWCYLQEKKNESLR